MDKSIENKIDKAVKTVNKLVSKIETVVEITSDEGVSIATEYLVQVKNRLKEHEEERTSYTQPINESLRRINARFKEITEPLKAAETKLKSAILDYRAKIEEKRLEAEKELQNTTGSNELVVESTLPDTVESKSGESRTVRRWTFNIEDFKKVPREYLTVDETKVDNAIKEGKREIKGLKIYQEESLSIYSKK